MLPWPADALPGRAPCTSSSNVNAESGRSFPANHQRGGHGGVAHLHLDRPLCGLSRVIHPRIRERFFQHGQVGRATEAGDRE